MPTKNFEAERRAIEAALAWERLARAPNQAKILAFIAQKYFAGQTADLKEYTIAVECLGRRSDFDPKQDSIVRVEVNRLRKSLHSYYEGDGREERVAFGAGRGGGVGVGTPASPLIMETS